MCSSIGIGIEHGEGSNVTGDDRFVEFIAL